MTDRAGLWRRWRVAVLTAGTAVLVAACGSGGSSSSSKVTFINRDQTAHTATGTTSGFDSGTVAPGKARTVTLRRPGSYAYVCQFHPFMHGVVIVRQG